MNFGFIPHARSCGEEKKAKKNSLSYKARRWVVEASHSWFTKFRKRAILYEKLDNHTLLSIIWPLQSSP